MKPDLSPDDLDGLIRQNDRRILKEQAEQAEYDRESPASLPGGWLFAAFCLFLVIAVALAGWSLAK